MGNHTKMCMIQINNLTKVYKLSKRQMQKQKTTKKAKIAVDNVSFTAEKGEIFGLLGPNGAGKTTTLRCIATLLKPTEGTIDVEGSDTVNNAEDVRKKICLLTNDIKLDPQFSAKYLFDFFGRMHGMDAASIDARREELFDYFDIKEFQDKKIEELSTGMKQKAAIAVSLVHNPDVIIFDEPTSGLDIITARSVTDYLIKLKNEGKLVIISTHIMSEAQKLCDRIAIIIDGKKVADGTIQSILSSTETADLEDAFFKLYKENHQEEA